MSTPHNSVQQSQASSSSNSSHQVQPSSHHNHPVHPQHPMFPYGKTVATIEGNWITFTDGTKFHTRPQTTKPEQQVKLEEVINLSDDEEQMIQEEQSQHSDKISGINKLSGFIEEEQNPFEEEMVVEEPRQIQQETPNQKKIREGKQRLQAAMLETQELEMKRAQQIQAQREQAEREEREREEAELVERERQEKLKRLNTIAEKKRLLLAQIEEQKREQERVRREAQEAAELKEIEELELEYERQKEITNNLKNSLNCNLPHQSIQQKVTQPSKPLPQQPSKPIPQQPQKVTQPQPSKPIPQQPQKVTQPQPKVTQPSKPLPQQPLPQPKVTTQVVELKKPKYAEVEIPEKVEPKLERFEYKSKPLTESQIQAIKKRQRESKIARLNELEENRGLRESRVGLYVKKKLIHKNTPSAECLQITYKLIHMKEAQKFIDTIDKLVEKRVRRLAEPIRCLVCGKTCVCNEENMRCRLAAYASAKKLTLPESFRPAEPSAKEAKIFFRNRRVARKLYINEFNEVYNEKYKRANERRELIHDLEEEEEENEFTIRQKKLDEANAKRRAARHAKKIKDEIEGKVKATKKRKVSDVNYTKIVPEVIDLHLDSYWEEQQEKPTPVYHEKPDIFELPESVVEHLMTREEKLEAEFKLPEPKTFMEKISKPIQQQPKTFIEKISIPIQAPRSPVDIILSEKAKFQTMTPEERRDAFAAAKKQSKLEKEESEKSLSNSRLSLLPPHEVPGIFNNSQFYDIQQMFTENIEKRSQFMEPIIVEKPQPITIDITDSQDDPNALQPIPRATKSQPLVKLEVVERFRAFNVMAPPSDEINADDFTSFKKKLYEESKSRVLTEKTKMIEKERKRKEE